MGSRRSAAADAVEERRAGAGTPLADASHRGLASWTGPGGRLGRGWRWFRSGGWRRSGWGRRRGHRFRLPRGALGVGEHGWFAEQGADAVEVLTAAWMQPAEAPHAVKARRQHVLEEPTDELEGLQIDGSPLSGVAVAVGPAETAVGEEREDAIAGRGLEDVATEVAQGILPRTGLGTVDDPPLFPNLRRYVVCLHRGLGSDQGTEQIAEPVAQGEHRQQEVCPTGHPLASIRTEAAAGDEVVDVGVVDERASPGVKHAEHPERCSQPAGIAGQVLHRPGTGVEEQVVACLWMGTQPRTKGLRNGERDQEVRHGQQQCPVPFEPVVRVLDPALWTVAIVTGVIVEVLMAAVRTKMQRPPERRSAALEDGRQHLLLARRHGRAETFEVGRCPPAQHLVHAQRFAAVGCGGRAHGGRASEVAHQGIEPLLVLGLAEGGQVGIDGRDHRAAMTEVDLELAQVFALFEEVGGVGMAQGVDRGVLLDAAGIEGQAEGALECGAAHRLGGGAGALATVALGGEQQLGMAMGTPQLAEQIQGALRQRNEAVAVSFATADVKEHPTRIDVGHVEVEGFAQAQAAGIDGAQSDAVVESGHRCENTADLLGGEDHRQPGLGGGAGEGEFGRPGALEGLFPEQLDGAEGLRGGGTGETTLGLEVDEVLTQVLGLKPIRGATEVLGQLAQTGPVGALAAGLEGQEREVVGEALQDCVLGGLFLCMGLMVEVLMTVTSPTSGRGGHGHGAHLRANGERPSPSRKPSPRAYPRRSPPRRAAASFNPGRQ